MSMGQSAINYTQKNAQKCILRVKAGIIQTLHNCAKGAVAAGKRAFCKALRR